MQTRKLIKGLAVALTGWLVIAPGNMVRKASADPVAPNSYYYNGGGPAWDGGQVQYIDWYQGQEGQWHRGPNGNWEWHGKGGNDWYWGQKGHWYKEKNGWQFASQAVVCNAQGHDCRRGRYLPPNGEGMVNGKNPGLYWACDSEGHHCHWAPRPRY